MTENSQVKAIPDRIDAHEQELTTEAEPTQAGELITQVHGLDTEIENLRTTRKTLLVLPGPGRRDP